VQVHTDSSFLTVLMEDDRIGSLEVADPDTGEFEPVDPPRPPRLPTRQHRHGRKPAQTLPTDLLPTLSSHVRLYLTSRHAALSLELGRFGFLRAMQAWSNGELHNAKHGVLCVAAAPRFTVGRGHVPVGAPGRRRGARARGAHMDARRPRRFRAFNYGAYRRARHFTLGRPARHSRSFPSEIEARGCFLLYLSSPTASPCMFTV
jgi:hypothetical protein